MEQEMSRPSLDRDQGSEERNSPTWVPGMQGLTNEARMS
jgi:hypothetical protein